MLFNFNEIWENLLGFFLLFLSKKIPQNSKKHFLQYQKNDIVKF